MWWCRLLWFTAATVEGRARKGNHTHCAERISLLSKEQVIYDGKAVRKRRLRLDKKERHRGICCDSRLATVLRSSLVSSMFSCHCALPVNPSTHSSASSSSHAASLAPRDPQSPLEPPLRTRREQGPSSRPLQRLRFVLKSERQEFVSKSCSAAVFETRIISNILYLRTQSSAIDEYCLL